MLAFIVFLVPRDPILCPIYIYINPRPFLPADASVLVRFLMTGSCISEQV